MRNIVTVMNQIEGLIPGDYLQKGPLSSKFKRIAQDSAYKAPEQSMQPLWERLCSALTEYLPDPNQPRSPEWAKEISKLIQSSTV